MELPQKIKHKALNEELFFKEEFIDVINQWFVGYFRNSNDSWLDGLVSMQTNKDDAISEIIKMYAKRSEEGVIEKI